PRVISATTSPVAGLTTGRRSSAVLSTHAPPTNICRCLIAVAILALPDALGLHQAIPFGRFRAGPNARREAVKLYRPDIARAAGRMTRAARFSLPGLRSAPSTGTRG